MRTALSESIADVAGVYPLKHDKINALVAAVRLALPEANVRIGMQNHNQTFLDNFDFDYDLEDSADDQEDMRRVASCKMLISSRRASSHYLAAAGASKVWVTEDIVQKLAMNYELPGVLRIDLETLDVNDGTFGRVIELLSPKQS